MRSATYQDHTRMDANQHCPPSFQTFHPFANFPLAHTFIVILSQMSLIAKPTDYKILITYLCSLVRSIIVATVFTYRNIITTSEDNQLK
jgi:hypothetical protein